MGKKHKRHKRGRSEKTVWPSRLTRAERLERATLAEGGVRTALLERGLSLNVNVCHAPHGQYLHWLFVRENTTDQVLQWWPSSGTWWCPVDGVKGKTDDPWELVEIAVKCACLPTP
jgi:hypothetical protein